MTISASRLPHTATVEPYQGSGAYGDTFGDPFTFPCRYEGAAAILRGTQGDIADARGTVYANEGVDVPPGSRLTVNGATMTVSKVSTFDNGGRGGHLEIAVDD